MTQDPEDAVEFEPKENTDLTTGIGPVEPGTEQPEADLAEQSLALDDDVEEFDPPEALPAEAGEADVLDQRRIVPPPDEDIYLGPE